MSKKKAETQKNLTETQQLIVQKNEEIAALEKKIEQREYVIKKIVWLHFNLNRDQIW
ncbi:hypothetical protein GCM10020331_026860 [Ectobacillus funiculus]